MRERRRGEGRGEEKETHKGRKCEWREGKEGREEWEGRCL